MPTLAAALSATPTFGENLQYQITGILVVLFTLGALALVVWLAGKVFTARSPQQASARAPAPAAAAEAVPGPIYAAIAAAVSVALEDRHFVIHGVRLTDPRVNMAWGAEGRRSIYASRKLR